MNDLLVRESARTEGRNVFVEAAFLHLNLIIQAGAVHNGLYLGKKKGKTVKVDIYVIEKTFY